MNIHPIARRIILICSILILVLIAWVSITGGVKQLPHSLTIGQKVETILQLVPADTKKTTARFELVPIVFPLIEGTVTDKEYLAHDVEIVEAPTAVETVVEPPEPKFCRSSAEILGVPELALAQKEISMV